MLKMLVYLNTRFIFCSGISNGYIIITNDFKAHATHEAMKIKPVYLKKSKITY